MANISLPSDKFIVVDAPEVRDFKVEFVYNFFVADEKVNESGLVNVEYLRNIPRESLEEEIVDSPNFNRFVPRYNKITWTPHARTYSYGLKQFQEKIKDNRDKVYEETTFSSEKYIDIPFGNPSNTGFVNYFVQRLIDVTYREDELLKKESLMDITKHLKNFLSEEVNTDIIENSLNNPHVHFHWILDEKTGKNISMDKQGYKEQEADYGNFGIQINKKYSNSIVRQGFLTSLVPDNKFSRKIINELRALQSSARNEDGASRFSYGDYDFNIDEFVSVEPCTSDFEPTSQAVGYIISKTEITSTGETIEHEPIYIESPTVSSTVDLKIKYGSTYIYDIKSVSHVKFQAVDIEENEIVAVSLFVASKPSMEKVVTCKEYTPPSPPADIQILWDYRIKKPIITWNFPHNMQRDIKYFQVFKRNSTDEPFRLLKMFDFDDSIIKSTPREIVSKDLIEVLDSPSNRFVDYSYQLGEEPIYTVCSVDAHGFTSNYGTQFSIRYEERENKIVKTLVSLEGAPKAYPNFLLNEDAFVDSIKTSGYSQMKVIFNPEYLDVYDKDGKNLNIFKTGEQDKYQLQLINVDVQEQQVFDIKLKNARKVGAKEEDRHYIALDLNYY